MTTTSTTKRKKAGRPKNPIPKEKLLDIAAELFAQHGYFGTSLDLIAAQAGIHRVSLLHHFPSKKMLYCTVLDEILRALHNFIVDSKQIDGNYREALDQLGNRVITYFSEHSGAARLIVRELVDGGPYFKGTNEKAVLEILQVTKEFLESGMDAGVFIRQDPKQLAISIVGIHLYYFSTPSSIHGFFGTDAYSPKVIALRREAVLSHVRNLCYR